MLRNLFSKRKDNIGVQDSSRDLSLAESFDVIGALESDPVKESKEAQGQVHLLPDELYRGPASKLSVAVLGTCLAEGFVNAAVKGGHKADHYLMQSRAEDSVPQADWSQYDAVVVHLTLRQLSWSVSGRPDLFHTSHMTDGEYASALAVIKAQIQRMIGNINAAVGSAAPVFYFSFIEPPAAYQGVLLNNRRKSLHHFVRTLNDDLATMLEELPNAHYIEVNDLVRYHGDSVVSDAYQVHFTHAGVPDSREADQIYYSIMKRVVHAMSILRAEAPIKLIVTDLDNTLWTGILAEMDEIVPHEHYEGWPLGYAEALLEFKRRGGLLAISSKNDHEPTIDRFGKVWGTRLKIEDFCSVKINWEPKSKAIQEIMQETNLLPGNILFIDDNPREIEEVTRALPGVRALTGEPRMWRNVILYSPHTQVARISAESATRTEMIQAKQQRDELAEQMDRDSYLRSLELTVRFDEIGSIDHAKFARASELINKTNQFNTTGRRWSQADFETHLSQGGELIAASVADKFSDNGLVAVAAVKGRELIQMVMSCRVFGLGVENALVHKVQLMTSGEPLSVLFVSTGKNKACEAFLSHASFETDGDSVMLKRFIEHPAWIREGLPK
ncbi:HAD-IIIC family phosphatase [Paraburkholderia sacchari]|uniref:HAD-IIIC family phosphatase n=1 Tax=Paraburkholderia sacchari TaxID=159450 RepID=A0A8T6ZAD2_9BURK|nr:HAD-IIIC family phosphatase [Paraburkholderia sacchari]NLP61668.1 HAD-IIIC family phosphatase [Paraburkholderia sacchari]